MIDSYYIDMYDDWLYKKFLSDLNYLLLYNFLQIYCYFYLIKYL